jgi:uncharacterized membrane protein YhaH (DUF805 family)
MQYFIKCIKQYADFKGRARRKEYWMFALFNIILLILAMGLDNLLGSTFKVEALPGGQLPYGWLYLIVALATFLPGLAAGVRRLHDVNKSGWFYFIALIPLIGAIWLLVLFCTEGTRGPNQYGEDPKGNGPLLDIEQGVEHKN